jgi:hypothetical protein
MSCWNDCQDIEQILENLRINAVNLSEYHRKRFYHFKSFGKYFRIPIIVLSSITASASVGLQPVLRQEAISGLTCLLGFGIAVISSVELYLGIQRDMDAELALSKDYYSLAIEIYKCLTLSREHRTEEPKSYLDNKYGQYQSLTETSTLLSKRMKADLLANVPDGYDCSSETTLKKIELRRLPSSEKDLENPPTNRFMGAEPHVPSPLHEEEQV